MGRHAPASPPKCDPCRSCCNQLPTCPPNHLPACPPACLPSYPPTCLPTYLLAYLPTYLLSYPPTCLPTFPPTYVPTCPPACSHPTPCLLQELALLKYRTVAELPLGGRLLSISAFTLDGTSLPTVFCLLPRPTLDSSSPSARPSAARSCIQLAEVLGSAVPHLLTPNVLSSSALAAAASTGASAAAAAAATACSSIEVLELRGGCWSMPELTASDAVLANTLSSLLTHESIVRRQRDRDPSSQSGDTASPMGGSDLASPTVSQVTTTCRTITDYLLPYCLYSPYLLAAFTTLTALTSLTALTALIALTALTAFTALTALMHCTHHTHRTPLASTTSPYSPSTTFDLLLLPSVPISVLAQVRFLIPFPVPRPR